MNDKTRTEPGADEISSLLSRVARGDEEAMGALYRGFSRRIYAYALNHMRDPQGAEEIVVDTMYEVWRHADRFRGDSRFGTWLIGIARHKMLSTLRRRTPAHEDVDEMDEQLAAGGPEAFDLLAAKERRDGVGRCLGKLSDEHRECLYLVFYEEMSIAEVAAVQGCPENTVKTRLFCARQKIRNCLRLLLEAES